MLLVEHFFVKIGEPLTPQNSRLIFSIITPSFNQGPYIQETIDSVINQTGDFFIDYIVFDAGSKDETISILKDFERVLNSWPVVKEGNGLVFRRSPARKTNLGISFRWASESDYGQTHAINKGIKISVGEIVAYINSDDIYCDGAFEAVAQAYSGNPTVAGYYGEGIHFSKDSQFIELYPTEDFNSQRLNIYCPICQPSVFITRSTIDKVGAFNEGLRFSMDYEYWLRLTKLDLRLKYIPQIFAGTRLYQDAKTMKFSVKVHREIADVQLRILESVSDHWLDSLATLITNSNFGYRLTKGKLFVLVFSIIGFWLRLRYNGRVNKQFFRRTLAWMRA